MIQRSKRLPFPLKLYHQAQYFISVNHISFLLLIISSIKFSTCLIMIYSNWNKIENIKWFSSPVSMLRRIHNWGIWLVMTGSNSLWDMTCCAQEEIQLGGHDLWCPKRNFAWGTLLVVPRRNLAWWTWLVLPKRKFCLGNMTCVAQKEIWLGGHDLWCPRRKLAWGTWLVVPKKKVGLGDITCGAQEGIFAWKTWLVLPKREFSFGYMTCGAHKEILLGRHETFH